MTSGGSGWEVFPRTSSKAGVLQGSVPSATPFIQYVNDLPDVICNFDS